MVLPKRGVKDVLSGCFAGVVGTCIGHPLDTVKVRLQTQSHYRGALDCFLSVVKNEGVRSLYRGMGSPLVSLTILNMLSFSVYGQLKVKLQEWNQAFVLLAQEDPRLTTTNSSSSDLPYFLAGAGVGAIATFLSTPFEMVKVQLQLDNVALKQYRGTFHCAKELVKLHGPKILYNGFSVNMFREVVFCTVYFGCYEQLKHALNQYFGPTADGKDHARAILIAGGTSGVAAGFANFPLDVIKANLQGQPVTRAFYAERRGFREVVRACWARGGVRAFFSGLGPSTLRSAFVSSTRFSAYEFAFSFLSSLEEDGHR
ncbi:carrier superfamily protein [Acanthamoeba castellanii str. Neff]|uniref:Carrier superfamily protein n=1 Tax=Acanthamoeba castellanii (strain ATCC 30010 / Neff) TaxID=1257118 RepID=L8H7W6_ACACF|nr:carrier superfamily protein [Acanthamoeba castellanii str. Neff]ELR20561.1 carrier superfamily protein [Acanthamoeba castellanii str. Neff]